MSALENYQEAIWRVEVMPKATPFLKWAGGKRRVLGAILDAAPSNFERYLEPFLGGGALALALAFQPMLLNDANAELINAFRVVRDQLDPLLTLLDEHQQAHSEAYYYNIRQQKVTELDPLEQAARFIYLNKTCYNGLYRVNKHGQFNVPSGRYKNPVLYDRDNMLAVARVLAEVELFALDYRDFLEQHARPGDFIYLDPPYVPIGKYSDFKRYTKDQFREKDQYVLAQVYSDLVALGAYPVLSNSYSELALDLYSEHDILVLYAGRNINHDGTRRGPVPEILVRPKVRI